MEKISAYNQKAVMDAREKFYRKWADVLFKNKDASVLICGGGILDKNVFQSLGFKNVTVSNIDIRMTGTEYEPYLWKYADAENLPFDNGSFDYTVIHAAIHHSSSPHKVLTEMYRVSKYGLLAFESRDSFVMRFLEKCKLTERYECTAVYYNRCRYGGVNNTEIPNYIYRWTEREIEKTIQSYAPYCRHRYVYKYGTAFPAAVKNETKNSFKIIFINIIKPLYYIFVKLFPKEQNQFAFYVGKSDGQENIFPWLKTDNGKMKFNEGWANKKYKH